MISRDIWHLIVQAERLFGAGQGKTKSAYVVEAIEADRSGSEIPHEELERLVAAIVALPSSQKALKKIASRCPAGCFK